MSGYTHMLDTNIVSDLIRNPNGIVREKIEAVGVSSVCMSLIVAAEIRFGCEKKGSARLTKQAEAILAVLPILAMDAPLDREYGAIRHALEKAGKVIGPNDLLIAAHAKLLGLTLVTANEQGFRRVKGLRGENWLA